MKNIGVTLGHIRDTRTMPRQGKHLVTGKKEILIILAAKEVKERGVIKETTTNVEETVVAAREIGESVKHTAQQIGESKKESSRK
ncbi:MAG: hypothetical protein WBF33_36605 [Candidatus Nitrosopolaris sp.]|jgi:hypothetical protein